MRSCSGCLGSPASITAVNGARGEKKDGDDALRPCFDTSLETDLTRWIAACAAARRSSPALCRGDFQILLMTNRQLIFSREYEGERVLVAVNADGEPYTAHFNANAGRARDLITGEIHDFGGGSQLPPYSAFFWQIF